MLRYKSGTTGEEIKLNGDKIRARISESNLYEYAWEMDEKNIGTIGNGGIRRITKKPKEYELEVDFTGTKKERAENVNKFNEITERDVREKKPGRIYIRNEYIECLIVGSEPEKLKDRYRTVRKRFDVYAPNPFWITEKNFSYEPGKDIAPAQYLDHPFDYKYDYFDPGKGIGRLNNDHYADAHFRMNVYGPVVNPRILIGEYPYEVFTTVAKNEYLVIDSRAQTVVRTKQGGEKIDEFDNRNKEQSIFRKIPAGSHTINWSGDFGIDITLFQERSEPRWT